ncbi:hypothetical protein B0H14DRAFT_348671 [Mycena olivaceomarginata]|nr:hypothetical protein B0H14DRAFT_348671 [Mycena olivaceomarginata]
MAASFVGTFSNGIQDISAILPLLGTEQCERHVGSALCGDGTGGYLYAAVTPLSIFGSLGTAKAAFCIMVASFPLHGSRTLRQMGFTLAGDAAKMIAVTGDRYLAETRLFAILQKNYVHSTQHLSAAPAASASRLLETLRIPHPAFGLWNLKLLVFSLLVALLGVGPYLHFSIRHHTSFLLLSLTFPLVRVVGGLLCVFPAQLMIQHRVLVILQQRILFQRIKDLVANRHDVKLPARWKDDLPSEESLTALYKFLQISGPTPLVNIVTTAMGISTTADGITPGDAAKKLKSYIADPWSVIVLRASLMTGFLMTLAGYVGCFTLIQDSKSTSSDTYIWLGLEAVLSFSRMAVWASNPGWDDSDGITLALSKTDDESLSVIRTEGTSESQDLQDLLMDRSDFWGNMTAYCGPLNPDDLQKIDGFELWYAWLRVGDEDRLCLFLEGKYSDLCMIDEGPNSAFYDVGRGAVKWPFESEKRLTRDHRLMMNQKFKLAVFSHYSFIVAAKSSRPFHLMKTSWTLLNTSVETRHLADVSPRETNDVEQARAAEYDPECGELQKAVDLVLSGEESTFTKYTAVAAKYVSEHGFHGSKCRFVRIVVKIPR